MSKVTRTLAACVVGAALASCGGSSGVSAASYAKSVCTAASSWRSSIVGAGAKLQSATTSTSLTQTKSDYVAFVRALVSATSRARDQLSAAGTPSVSSGKAIASMLVGVFRTAEGSLSRAESEARAIPTNTKSALNRDLQLGATTYAISVSGNFYSNPNLDTYAQ